MKIKERVHVATRKLANGGTSLFLDYYLGGKRCRESLNLFLLPPKSAADRAQNAATVKMANAAKAKKIEELTLAAQGMAIKKNSDVTVADYFSKFISATKKSGTKRLNSSVLAAVKKFRAAWKLKDVDRKSFAEFRGYLQQVQGVSDASCRVYLTLLKARLHAANLDGLLAAMPDFSGLTPSSKPRQRTYITADELRTLAGTPSPCKAVSDAFLFCCYTGLRYSDVVQLKWRDIVGGVIVINMHKTGEPLRVPLCAAALRLLPPQTDGRELVFGLPSYKVIRNALAAWGAAAGLQKKVTYHVSRHTFATLALAGGAGLYTVSKLLGHTTVSTTQIYAHLLDDERKRAVDALPDIEV